MDIIGIGAYYCVKSGNCHVVSRRSIFFLPFNFSTTTLVVQAQRTVLAALNLRSSYVTDWPPILNFSFERPRTRHRLSLIIGCRPSPPRLPARIHYTSSPAPTKTPLLSHTRVLIPSLIWHLPVLPLKLSLHSRTLTHNIPFVSLSRFRSIEGDVLASGNKQASR